MTTLAELQGMDDAQVNRRAAQLDGWRTVPNDGEGGGFILYSPSGERVGWYGNEEEAWAAAPNFCGDLNAAWELATAQMPEADVSVCKTVLRSGVEYGAEIQTHDNVWIVEGASHPARALTMAYILATQGAGR